MENKPGRSRNVSGEGNSVGRKGEGLGGGPVGRTGGYGGRPGTGGSSGGPGGPNRGSSSGGERSGGGGIGKIIAIIVAVVAVLGGGGAGLGSLLGLFGGETGQSSSIGDWQTIGNISQYFPGSAAESSGWVRAANVGSLDTSVDPGARAKRTNVLGDKKDVVTLMVYMCGTDLESKSGMASADIEEMRRATIGSNVNLLVFTGGCKSWKDSSISSTVNQIYKIANGTKTCLESNYGADAMTSPSTLTKFIKYCVSKYPGNRYDLILWDHGGGTLTGYGYDEKNAKSGSMTIKGINEALNNAGTSFDFIGFDACLMATLENALMLEKHADYLIASEETEPGIGWYYTDWLTKLSQNTSMATVEIGKNIVDDFTSECARKCSGQKTTLSVIDLAELIHVVPDKLKAFAASASSLMQNGKYEKVSEARSGVREFSVKSKIDQVDLVHLATNLGTAEGEALAKALLGAVKYNKTSSAIDNAYGISIYFPYKKANAVESAAAINDAVGIDDAYSDCIRQFASLENAGQTAVGGSSSMLGSLLGSFTGSGLESLDSITSLLGGLSFGKGLNKDMAADYLYNHQFDESQLKIQKYNGHYVMLITKEQWQLTNDLLLNVFVDDGKGYIDLGLDNVYDFTSDGALIAEYDGSWLAINDQPVAYYFESSKTVGTDFIITGRVPVLLNGERAELLLTFDNDHPDGYISGARYVYGGETETEAKAAVLTEGDVIEFVADYYTYSGTYVDSYVISDEWNYKENYTVSNKYIPNETSAVYLFTDIYGGEHWSPVLEETHPER